MLVEVKQIEIRTMSARTLSDVDADAWRALQAADPVLESPLLGPDFARAVGRRRDDAEVAVFDRDGRPMGYLAYHRRPGALGRPIGAPFADYHGLVCAPELSLSGEEVLRRLELRAFRHMGLIDPGHRFAGMDVTNDGHLIRLDGSPDDHLEACFAARPKMFRNWRRLARRLAERGPLDLRAEPDPAAFYQLMRWKSAQFARTGLTDVLRPDWASGLMRDLFEMTEGPVRGQMLTLWSGDVLVAGEFGLRSDRLFHSWIAAINPELTAFSPGAAFMEHAIRAMPRLGLEVIDMAPGNAHSKRPFATGRRPATTGLTLVDGEAHDWTTGAVGKMRRRLDHIATADPTLAGRARGVWEAAGAVRKRLAPPSGDSS